ncbi:MAG TPA: Ig-like domain-containing protein [Candidatus Dormibacteraeota bacterium]|nr:Ig-like domain-containing protein [Candidatus Dormibacteraeota bacterium]
MRTRRDPELDQLFEHEPELRELAQLMRARPHPVADAEPSPHFRVALKQRLMREAWERASQPALPWYRRMLAPQPLAMAGATLGALLIVFTVFVFVTTPGGTNSTVTVRSELNNARTVSLVTSIPLTFTQSMDAASVQTAVTIQPATQATYQWQDNNKKLTITPVHDLAPNTQYVVKIAPSAKTQDGQALTNAPPVQFVTRPPTPTPTPTPTSQPTSTPAPQITSRLVAPSGNPASRWSTDGTRLYVVGPSGQLGAWSLQGQPAGTPIQPDGVTLVAVGPDGTVAYVRNGQISYGSVTVTNVQPIALGFGQSGVVFATASDVQSSDQRKLAGLAEQAAAADFSATADKLVYRGASGNLHLVDLTVHPARDTAVGPSTGLGDWSPDGTRYAYVTDAGISVVDTSTASSSKLLDFPGLTGLAWSRGNQLLLTTSSALYLYTPGDPGGAKKQADGDFRQPSWAPAGGHFSFKRGSDVWVGRMAAQGGSGTAAVSGAGQDELVNAFMAARLNLSADQAGTYLDAAGKEAFSSLTLIYTPPGPSLARYYVLLNQPYRVVVRLVLTKGTTQSAVDETLILKSSGGKLLIDGVSERPRASFGAGPEILKVTVAPEQLQVSFDSDLDQSTVQGSVSVKGPNGQAVNSQASYDARGKTVTLQLAGALASGATFDLVVSSGLKDYNGRQAVPYDLQFLGP